MDQPTKCTRTRADFDDQIEPTALCRVCEKPVGEHAAADDNLFAAARSVYVREARQQLADITGVPLTVTLENFRDVLQHQLDAMVEHVRRSRGSGDIVDITTWREWFGLLMYELMTFCKALEEPAQIAHAALQQKHHGATPDDLRDKGWSVAVHNDYKLNGERFTFWLMTKDGHAVKGEGRTDAEALEQIRQRVKTLI